MEKTGDTADQIQRKAIYHPFSVLLSIMVSTTSQYLFTLIARFTDRSNAKINGIYPYRTKGWTSMIIFGLESAGIHF